MPPAPVTVLADPPAPGTPPVTASPVEPGPLTCDLQPATPKRRLQGKIACLTKNQRDTINRLLVDGATYSVVIQRMAGKGVSLNHENVSNWFQTGFQHGVGTDY